MSDRKIAFMFPGQGSQAVGMGQALSALYPEAAEVFSEADSALGFPLSNLCFQGPAEELQLTINTQPAVLTASVAVYRVLVSQGVVPAFVVGHSLGEYSALVAAGSLDLADALVTVRRRGQYMQEAVPVGEGAMAAILGLDPETVGAICDSVRDGEVVASANFNTPIQTVIAGHRSAVQRAIPAAKDAGAKRAVLLPVSAPFHSSLMRPAEERLAADLEAIVFRDLEMPLVTNVDAVLIRKGEEARDALMRQPSRPVRWSESIRRLLDSEVDTFVEVGPGRVLTGLVRGIDKTATTLHVDDEASLVQSLAALR